jgi:U3 small nucleolar RNA-associated protein 4
MSPAAPPATVPLHRIRFFDHTPAPITALAFAPLPLPPARDPSAGKGKARSDEPAKEAELGALVVARDNGEVEIWGYVPAEQGGTGNWVLEKVSNGWRRLSGGGVGYVMAKASQCSSSSPPQALDHVDMGRLY